MNTPLSLDKSIKVEPYFLAPDRNFPDITKIDIIASKNKCQNVITSVEFCDLVTVMRSRFNSKYGVIVEIDPDGKVFGLNKMLRTNINYSTIDGCEIGLSNNKNYTELINEMKVTSDFIKQFGDHIKIRWIINAIYGSKHIENCIKAIKDCNIKYDLIRIITQASMEFKNKIELGNLIREGIGIVQAKIKLEVDPKDVVVLNNVLYSTHISKL
jgi:hypothetical protein